MKFALIVAMSENRVIGRGGQLPWRLSADLRRFRQLTMGHHLIMGRKTFESIGRALPGRASLVLSRQQDYHATRAVVVPDLRQAQELAAGDDEVFLVGGGQLYEQALPLVDRIYLTLVHTHCDGDVSFPELAASQWQLREQSPRHPADEKNDHDYTFLIYERVKHE